MTGVQTCALPICSHIRTRVCSRGICQYNTVCPSEMFLLLTIQCCEYAHTITGSESYKRLHVHGSLPFPGACLSFQPSRSPRSRNWKGYGLGCPSATFPLFQAHMSDHSFSSFPSSMSTTYFPMTGRNLKPWFDPTVAI